MRSADIRARSRHGKRLFRDFFRGAWTAAGLWTFLALATPAGAQVGRTFETLEAKGVVYRSAKVLALSASTVTVGHRGGIAQLPLRSLAPELQQEFGYDPAAEACEALLAGNERKLRERQAQAAAARAPAPRHRIGGSDTPVGRALARFGTPAALQAGVDLRPKFRELELGTKSQGLRPSCAVFAVVSALEYQNAAAQGRTEKLSEEYLIWATRRTLGIPAGEKRVVVVDEDGDNGDPRTRDAGFTLQEVLAALRDYGIPLQQEMPNTFGLGMEKIPEPAAEVVASARDRRLVSMSLVPGVDNRVKVANLMHALNEGVPVVVGLRWPHWRTLSRSALLSQQAPLEGRSHAVTIVGYFTENGQPDGLRFIFKNSWGIRWGTGGYGFVTIDYLQRNLLDAVVLEVRPTGG